MVIFESLPRVILQISRGKSLTRTPWKLIYVRASEIRNDIVMIPDIKLTSGIFYDILWLDINDLDLA